MVMAVDVPVTELVCEFPPGNVSTKLCDVFSGELRVMAVALVKMPPGAPNAGAGNGLE
jgi:hypothetical protein